MQFYNESEEISFQQFVELYPDLEAILSAHQEQSWSFVIESSGRLAFRHGKFSPWSIDIESQLEYHKVYFYKNSPFKELLAKAIGLKNNTPQPSVLDATAGALGDSIMLKALGIKELCAYERHPVAAALIMSLDPEKYEIDFKFCSAKSQDKKFDVIYFDPMYHEKNKKTSPKKEMQIFREIVGADEDALDTAVHLKILAKQRLVIKRSSKAKPLMDGPSHSIIGKSTSYDVYLTNL